MRSVRIQAIAQATVLSGLLFLAPLASHADTFANIVNNSIVPFGDKIIELMYALCFIVFLIGIVRLMFSQSDEQRQKGRYLAFWGIVALALLFAVWGVVRVLLDTLTSFST